MAKLPSPTQLGWFREACERYDCPLALALGVAFQESGFRQVARSGVGAIGVMQLMPQTAEGLGVDPNDMYQNIFGGCKLLGGYYAKYAGNLTKVLVAYNAGPGRVSLAFEKLPMETQRYVPAVKHHMARFQKMLDMGTLK